MITDTRRFQPRLSRFIMGTALIALCAAGFATGSSAQGTEPVMRTDSMLLLIKPEPSWMQSKHDRGGGVREWKSKDGIRILLYPFANPEHRISVHAFSDGGFYQHLKDSLFEEAIAAPYIWGTDLALARDPKDIEKILRGRMYDLHRFVGPYNEGFTLETRQSDLVIALEVFWMNLREPKIVPEKYSKYTSWINAGRPGTPADAFRDSIRLAMTRSNPLVVRELTFPKKALNDSLLLKAALARILALSDYTVVIAGDFSIDSITPMVEMYFGKLWPNAYYEEAVDVGIRPPPGIVRRTVRGRTDGKTLTRLEFYGSTLPTRTEFEQVNLLRDLLHATLLRELASSADSISVQIDWVRTPEQAYRFTVEFLTKPAAARSAVTSTLATIRALQEAPAQNLSATFDTVRDQSIHEFNTMMTTRSPDVAQRLLTFDAFQWPLAEVASDSILKQVTFKQVQDVTQKFLDLKNYGHFDMTPSSSSSTPKVR